MALKILLADESSTINKVFDIALKSLDSEVKTVQHGVDVLEVAESFQPDVIFIEVLLSKMNGYEVCSQIKQNSQLQKIHVVLMWSGFMDLDEDKFVTCQADAKLEKPFSGNLLIETIHKALPEGSEAIKIIEGFMHSSGHVIANPFGSSPIESLINKKDAQENSSQEDSQDLFGVLSEGLEFSKVTNLENSEVMSIENSNVSEIASPSNPSQGSPPLNSSPQDLENLSSSQVENSNSSPSPEEFYLPPEETSPPPPDQAQKATPPPEEVFHPPSDQVYQNVTSPQEGRIKTAPETQKTQEHSSPSPFPASQPLSPPPPPPPPASQQVPLAQKETSGLYPINNQNVGSSMQEGGQVSQPEYENLSPKEQKAEEFYSPEPESSQADLNFDSFQNVDLTKNGLPVEDHPSPTPPGNAFSGSSEANSVDPSEEVTVIPSYEEEQALLNKIREDARLRQSSALSKISSSPLAQNSYSGELNLNQNAIVHRNVEDSFHPPSTPPQNTSQSVPPISPNSPNVIRENTSPSKDTTRSVVEEQVRETVQSLVWEIVPDLARQIIEKEVKRLLAEEDIYTDKKSS